ncbi:NAD(P)-binding protein [Thozetella sp. PMI_491]|nr:NAD(P)-binding protein [Thozetella sp. PMI_491]
MPDRDMDTIKHSYTYGGQITHSLSPTAQSILFKSISASWTYELRITTNVEEFRQTIHSPDCIGASITMPNKLEFMAAMDEITEEAQAIGAINTCFVRLDPGGNRRYIGDNTDCLGLRDVLLAKAPGLPAQTQGKPVLVIGGGGAARSAIYSLWKWFSPSEIYIVNRLKSEVKSITSDMSPMIPGIRLRHIESVDDAEGLPAPRLAIGTIPDIPPVSPDEIVSWNICETLFRHGDGAIFLDMCYSPPRTTLVKLAQKNAWKVISGAEVILGVAICQQRLWLEEESDPTGVQEASLYVRSSAPLE